MRGQVVKDRRPTTISPPPASAGELCAQASAEQMRMTIIDKAYALLQGKPGGSTADDVIALAKKLEKFVFEGKVS